jgi:hypothetical protein
MHLLAPVFVLADTGARRSVGMSLYLSHPRSLREGIIVSSKSSVFSLFSFLSHAFPRLVSLARCSHLQNHCLQCPSQHAGYRSIISILVALPPLCLGQLFTLAAAA